MLSLGFAFVEFQNTKDALTACKALQNTQLDGHQLTIKVSSSQSTSSGRAQTSVCSCFILLFLLCICCCCRFCLCIFVFLCLHTYEYMYIRSTFGIILHASLCFYFIVQVAMSNDRMSCHVADARTSIVLSHRFWCDVGIMCAGGWHRARQSCGQQGCD